LEASRSPRATPNSRAVKSRVRWATTKGEEGAGPTDRWSVTREGVTVGAAPLRDPWAPQGLPIAGPSCLADVSCDAGLGITAAHAPVGRAAHTWRLADRVLDIGQHIRKVRAD